jgi:glycosyltransferase involved in cell wall biosynthesis
MTMNKRLNVLHVISQRPDSTGSGIYLQAILGESARNGYDNALVAAVQEGSTVTLSGLTPDNCDLVYFDPDNGSEMIIGMSDVMPYPSRRFQDLDTNGVRHYLRRFTEPLTTMVLRHNPDIIHSHHLWLLSTLVKDLFPDIPLITSCHGSDLRQFNQCPYLKKQVLDGCHRIDKVLALSSEQKNEIIDTYQLPADRIDIAGAGYNKNIFYADKGSRNTGPVNILSAGKISRAKGVPWLLRALTKIDAHRYHLHLVGGGSGREYDECRAAAALLGPQVSLHGMVSQQNLAQLMRSSQIFILPSLHEGLPLVVLEALACGCTVITTDLPGTREIKNRLETNQLILIEKPTVQCADISLLADEQRFVDSLKQSLEQCLSQQRDDSDNETKLSYFSWDSVFSRVEQSWLSMLNEPDKFYI